MNGGIQNVNGALAIYNTGYAVFGMRMLDAKTYYEKIYELVVQEYKMQGFCNLVDKLIEDRIDIEVLAFASLQEAERILRGYTKQTYGPYIPSQVLDMRTLGINRQLTWEEWTSHVQKNGRRVYRFEDHSIKRVLLNLKSVGQKCHLSEMESKRIIEKKAETIQREANAEAKKILQEAKEEADRIKSDALKETSQAKKNMQSDDAFKRLIKTYLSREREALRESLDKEFVDVLNQNRLTLGKSEEIHNDMCDQSNALQASWVKTLETTVNELTKIKEDFYSRIRSWQVSLYPHELQPLAERYIELYRILNIDKLIAEEIHRLHFVENNNKGEQNYMMKSTSGEEWKSSPILDGLDKLNRTLTIFLRKFEVSLNGLDMYVYYPKQGDHFDEIWHVPEDDTNFDYSKSHEVASCVLPGVAKKINDVGEDDVIIPAIVSVKMR